MKVKVNYISKALERSVDIQVVIPTPGYTDVMGITKTDVSYSPTEKFPVIYLLHGIGNDASAWLAYTQVELFAEENKIAVVTVSAENRFYINHDGAAFETFIQDEIPELVCGMFPISRRVEDQYIAGLSMGGYGAMLHAMARPEKYAAVGCFSGALEMNERAKENKDYDIKALIEKNVKENKKMPKIYFSCGENDFVYWCSKNLKDNLDSLGVDYTFESVPGYTHEWRFWNLEIEKFMKWIPRTDAYKRG